MECVRCGVPMDDGDTWCRNCGTDTKVFSRLRLQDQRPDYGRLATASLVIGVPLGFVLLFAVTEPWMRISNEVTNHGESWLTIPFGFATFFALGALPGTGMLIRRSVLFMLGVKDPLNRHEQDDQLELWFLVTTLLVILLIILNVVGLVPGDWGQDTTGL